MILDKTLDLIGAKINLHCVGIQDIYLSNYFNVVQLDDGSVGACMNYFHFPSQQNINVTRQRILDITKHDPLLFTYLCGNEHDPVFKFSLKAAITSALSKNLILRDRAFTVRHRFDPSIFSDVGTATVIGFGGYMEQIVKYPTIHNIHISDLLYEGAYPHITDRMNERIAEYRSQYPQKEISLSNGFDTEERIHASELVSITASALCNGTMDTLLTYAQKCKTIIVQGQSGCIYPEALFKQHVSFISTTIKPDNLLQRAVRNFRLFRYLLEGNLPKIYITLT